MSHLIITSIRITRDDRVIVERASNNLRPLEFRTVEIEQLTSCYRRGGIEALEEELLWLFFQGLWQGHTRFDRALAQFKDAEKIDPYAEHMRCYEDVEYRTQRMKYIAANYLVKITMP